MKITKIDILTLNKKHATDIAMLVDQHKFLQEIQRLRQKWKISKLYPVSNIYEPPTEKLHLKGKEKQFNHDIETVLKKFHRGKNFKNIVEYALINGIIPDGVYLSCYFDVVMVSQKDDLSRPEQYEYVIIMSARTEKKELEAAYKAFQEFIKGHEPTNEFDKGIIGKINFQNSPSINAEVPDHRELIEQFHKGTVYDSADISKYKTKKEIERTREWYWTKYSDIFNGLSKKSLTYDEVLNKWQQENCPVNMDHADILSKRKCDFCSIEDINIIEKAISSYNRLLKSS